MHSLWNWTVPQSCWCVNKPLVDAVQGNARQTNYHEWILHSAISFCETQIQWYSRYVYISSIVVSNFSVNHCKCPITHAHTHITFLSYYVHWQTAVAYQQTFQMDITAGACFDLDHKTVKKIDKYDLKKLLCTCLYRICRRDKTELHFYVVLCWI